MWEEAHEAASGQNWLSLMKKWNEQNVLNASNEHGLKCHEEEDQMKTQMCQTRQEKASTDQAT